MALSDVRMMVGNMRIESAIAPAIAEKPPIASTTAPYANTPARMDGKPVSTLAANRTAPANLLSCACAKKLR